MKIVSQLIAVLFLTALTGSVFAQSVSVGSVVGQKGNQVVLEPTFTAGAQEVDVVQFVVTFENTGLANFSAVTVPQTCGGSLGTNNQCVISPSQNAFQIIVSNGTSAMPSGTLASITFTLDGAATAGDVALVVDQTSVVIGRDGSPADPAVPVADGTIGITDGPQPVWGSNPTAAAGVSMSGQITNIIAADVIVDNAAGATGSTLTYTCAETADVDNVFSLAGQTTNHSLAVGDTGTVSIGCDSGTIGSYTGTMECSHNAAGSPETFALACNVTAGPEPAFTAVADVTLAAAQEGDADPTGSVTITNTGDTGTTLTGTCSLSGPDAQISLTGGAFSVAQGAAGAVVGVSCDASAEGDYTNTVSCAHNGTNVATPQTFPVTCSVGPAGAAIFQSTPAAGTTIELTPEDVPVGATVPDQTLTINNAATDLADNDLILSNCAFTGDAAITVGAAPSSPIAPNGSASTTFSCATTTVGDYTGTYACDYSVDGGSTTTPASYPVHCGVRAAGSELNTVPEPGVLSMHVPMNGTGYAVIEVSEVLDEGVDATIDSCTLTDGTNFTILTTFPLTVPAGETVLIEVEGTDPQDGSFAATDVMTCTGTDTVNGTGTGVWDLALTVQTAAIPTLSTWGLLAMFLTMLGFGGIVLRRKENS